MRCVRRCGLPTGLVSRVTRNCGETVALGADTGSWGRGGGEAG
jgi:hypothetical protein